MTTALDDVTELDDETTRPAYYGGADDPFEPVKVWYALGMGPAAHFATALKYLCRAGKKGDHEMADLRKAAWYINSAIELGYRWPYSEAATMNPYDVVNAWGLTGDLAEAALLLMLDESPREALAALKRHISKREDELGA